MTTATAEPKTHTWPATPAKLRDGSWGARIELKTPDQIELLKIQVEYRSAVCTITTQGGKTWDAAATQIISAAKGKPVLVRTGKLPAPKPAAPKPTVILYPVEGEYDSNGERHASERQISYLWSLIRRYGSPSGWHGDNGWLARSEVVSDIEAGLTASQASYYIEYIRDADSHE